VTNKNFAEIPFVESLLPHVSLQLCTFHCFKAVQRKSALLSSMPENCGVYLYFIKLLKSWVLWKILLRWSFMCRAVFL